jgi:hypothetical protein
MAISASGRSSSGTRTGSSYCWYDAPSTASLAALPPKEVGILSRDAWLGDKIAAAIGSVNLRETASTISSSAEATKKTRLI